jgi:hypothetical protein
MSDAEPADTKTPPGGTSLPNPAQPSDAPPVGDGASGGGDKASGQSTSAASSSGGGNKAAGGQGSGDTTSSAGDQKKPGAGDDEKPGANVKKPDADDEEKSSTGDGSVPTDKLAEFSGNSPLEMASFRVLDRHSAHHIFQAKLEQLRDAKQEALTSQPSMSGQLPPARFDAPADVRIPDSKFVGVPATAQDTLGDAFTCDGFGGLEALIGVEGLSEAQVREVARRVAPDASSDRDFLVPRDSEWTAGEFRRLLESPGAKRELASLVRLYGTQDLARRVFWMVTLFRRTLDRLNRAEEQLKSSGSA